MRKKIAILGSTGSIGRNLLEIVNKDKNKFEVTLLTANKNHTDLLKQAKRFKKTTTSRRRTAHVSTIRKLI